MTRHAEVCALQTRPTAGGEDHEMYKEPGGESGLAANYMSWEGQ